MALKDLAAEQLLADLIGAGLATEQDRTVLEFSERQGQQFTAELLAGNYMDDDTRYRMKPDQIELFRQVIESNGLDTAEYVDAPVREEEEQPWYKSKLLAAFGTNVVTGPTYWAARAIMGTDIDVDIPGARDVAEFMSGGEEALAASKFDTAARKSIFQTLDAMGVEYDRPEVMRLFADKERNYVGLQEYLSGLNLSYSDVSQLMNDGMIAGQQAYLRHKGVEDEIAAVAEEEEILLSDDEKLQGKKEYEILEEAYPGKYVFDVDSGRIYEAGSGSLVDNNGVVVIPDENGMYPEGISSEDTYFYGATEAAGVVPPWTDYNIDEDTYYGLLDVVSNPDQYHGEGIGRFTSGESFIGGFGSDYGVAQDEATQLTQRDDRWNASVESAAGGMMGGDYSAYKDSIIQSVRRPWYDQGDNWALYAGLSPESAAVEQQKLVAMGALDASDVVDGVWGAAEAQAVEQMMIVANGRAEKLEDIDPSFWNEYWADAAAAGAASRRGFVRPAYEKLDMASAELTIQDTIRRSLGRDATESELADLGMHMSDMHRQSFVADVGAMEAEYSAETRAIDTGAAQSAGEYQGVDWEAQFMTKFNETHEAELARYDRTQDVSQRQQLIGGALNNFMSQLGGGIGGGSIGGQ